MHFQCKREIAAFGLEQYLQVCALLGYLSLA